jgi:3-dehydroquinate dehydratase-2
MNILIINGPNLNLLGVREPEIYGSLTFEAYFEILKQKFNGVQLHYFQSNHEGELIDRLHQDGFKMDGIIINAGAYTHTSVAIADAISAIKAPVVEVHISNVFKRENFRHHSFVSPVAIGVICGFGMDSYRMAVDFLVNRK